MKVLFISHNSPFESIGDIERYIINLINFYKSQTETEIILVLPATETSHVVKEGSVILAFLELRKLEIFNERLLIKLGYLQIW